MTAFEVAFYACDYGVVPFWLLLVVLPRARVTAALVHGPIPALLLVPTYAWLLFGDVPGPQGASFFTLEGVTQIFTTPRTIAACWVHYLVFDLFVGSWEARDARRVGVPHWALVPCLVLTLMFGPIGFLGYLGARFGFTRRVTLDEAGA
jgi:hypothetical protein